MSSCKIHLLHKNIVLTPLIILQFSRTLKNWLKCYELFYWEKQSRLKQGKECISTHVELNHHILINPKNSSPQKNLLMMLTPTSVLLTFSALSSKTANFPALKWRTVSPSNLHLSAMPLEIRKFIIFRFRDWDEMTALARESRKYSFNRLYVVPVLYHGELVPQK